MPRPAGRQPGGRRLAQRENALVTARIPSPAQPLCRRRASFALPAKIVNNLHLIHCFSNLFANHPLFDSYFQS
jgi:hypothetical protein